MPRTKRSLRNAAALLAACALFAAGCAGMKPEGRQILQQPANCERAQMDIHALKDTRAAGGLRFVQGIQAIAPPMVVLSLLRDLFIGKPYRSVYLDHWRVAFGSYNKKIDARVSELESCGN